MDSGLIRLLHNVRSVLTRTVELHPSERWPRLVLEKVILRLHGLEADLPVETNQQGEPVTMPEALASRDHWRALAEDAIADAEILEHELIHLRNNPPGHDASPDDLRAKGWMVAAHNDYRERGGHRTFWLFTREDRAIKGEGDTDAEALDLIRLALLKHASIGSPIHEEIVAAAEEDVAMDYSTPNCGICHPSHYGLEWNGNRFIYCTGPAHDFGPPREEPT